jgi:hypothetical protein
VVHLDLVEMIDVCPERPVVQEGLGHRTVNCARLRGRAVIQVDLEVSQAQHLAAMALTTAGGAWLHDQPSAVVVE